MITENQLIGVNNTSLAVGFYNDRHGDSHGYTYDVATKTFSADIDDPMARARQSGDRRFGQGIAPLLPEFQ